ncbi:uncharacterized protein KGF55_000919 [Candida pseudojiufengensis]|uniref:uncharacterized protein n=1 Tax=Candida pseudojiufengensis TaxID=497109 RepID=UPI002225826D|nr:uncharacterized protein KGF55_000919 [Candida pseudojiufengensis]KAI5965557.1 hypothetical protein KGF55_000919 [Candida pseudojiufengensis]
MHHATYSIKQFHSSSKLQFHPIIENIVEEIKEEEDGNNNDEKVKQGTKEEKDKNSKYERFKSFLMKCIETMGITISSIGILALAGYLYHIFYNEHVLKQMNKAFEKNDPASELELYSKGGHNNSDLEIFKEHWVKRPQQQLLDDIIAGKIIGRYFLIIGEKGTGKSSLLKEAIKKVDGFNVVMLDASRDEESFRFRLGQALNYSYNEMYLGSLFSIRGPRDTTALLDIERAFSKLEELAIRRVKEYKRPLIMIINNAHLIKENEEGIKLLELLQQKSESLSGSGLMTVIFNSDDYWVYEKLKQLGTRLELINVRDFSRIETLSALKFIRHRYFPKDEILSNDVCNAVYDLIGGRPQHITQVARNKDLIKACHQIIDREKTWLLNKCGLLGDMDDDVMESGKFATSAMLLMKEFVNMDRKRMNTVIGNGEKTQYVDHHLPELPLWRARQVMTRADYIQKYDDLNIFTIDSESRVRADSVPMMRAFHEIASQPHFDQLLEDTINRISDIEALGRTREIMLKDLNLGSKYKIIKDGKEIEMTIKKSPKQMDVHGEFEEYNKIEHNEEENDDEDEDDLYLEEIHRKDSRKWWKKRMEKYDELYLPKPLKGFETNEDTVLDISRVDEE